MSEAHWKDSAAALRALAPSEEVPPGLRPLMLQAASDIEELRLVAFSLSLNLETFINQHPHPMDAKGMELAQEALAKYKALARDVPGH